MMAARVHAFGGPEVIRYEPVARPLPGPGEGNAPFARWSGTIGRPRPPGPSTAAGRLVILDNSEGAPRFLLLSDSPSLADTGMDS